MSFVQCEQVKFRPKKKVKIQVSHSVVAVGIVGEGGKAVKHDMNLNSAISLIRYTIFNEA